MSVGINLRIVSELDEAYSELKCWFRLSCLCSSHRKLWSWPKIPINGPVLHT